MKTSGLCYIFAILLFSCWSCNNSDNNPAPSLSHETLDINVGENALLTVHNAEHISASSGIPVVDLNITRNRITISAIKPGQTTIDITADNRHQLQCLVTVNETENLTPEGDRYSFEPELCNSETRYVSKEITMYYNTGGIIVSVKKDNDISFLNLDNGQSVNFKFDGQPAIGQLQNPVLTINRQNINIANASIEQLNDDGLWIHITTDDNEHIPLVITALSD
ncbi:MAG: hypothetical protein IJY30_01155 [Muribaculaceae bacterium]|nr:hypothetical protein [Muribaculaceae bacterium]